MEREQRAHARKRLSTAVTFNVPGGESLRGWLRDISRGGCFVATPSFLSVGQTVDVVLRLPGVTKLLVGKARIVWVREKSIKDLPAGMGVEFVEMAEDSLATIDAVNATSAAAKKSRTFIGVAPPPPTSSSPSFSPEMVPQEVVDALKAEAAAAREADLEKTEKTQLPVEKIEAEAIEAEANPPEEAPPPPPPSAPRMEPPPAPLTPPIDLPQNGGPKRKKWLFAAGLGALGAAGLIVLVIAFTHRGGGAADAAAEAQSDALVAEDVAMADATLAAIEPDVGAPTVDAHVEDATVDAHAHDAGRDGGHDGGRDAGRGRDAGHDAGHHKPKPRGH